MDVINVADLIKNFQQYIDDPETLKKMDDPIEMLGLWNEYEMLKALGLVMTITWPEGFRDRIEAYGHEIGAS
jgi:hypothetical protein